MNINSVRGIDVYQTNALAEDTRAAQNNREDTADAESNKTDSQSTRQAFQVDITQEALDLQAENENTEDFINEQQELNAQLQTEQSQGHQGSRLDIIA